MMDDMTPGDQAELRDVEVKIRTEGMLYGRTSWPLGHTLPVKREVADAPLGIETGYVLREGVAAAPIVYTEGERIASRRYASLEQMLDAGWRVD